MMQMRRRRLSDQQVKALKVRPSRYTLPDPELVGHYVRVHPSGAKSYVAVARDPFNKQIWTTIGATDHLPIDQARAQARAVIARVKAGKPAVEPPAPAPDSFATVSENWVRRHVAAKELRTRSEIERCLNRYVLPHWRDRPFGEIKRRDVAKLLDHIEDEHGARQADAVLTIIRSITGWHSTRDDDYVSPVVKGMKRSSNGARKRTLSDGELRGIWQEAETGGAYGSLVQLALLTGQRRDKLLSMKWSDISAEGVWTIPSEAREKGSAGELILPELARAVLRRQPRVLGADLVFPPSRGKRYAASHGKAALDAKLPEMPQWQLHDLRRTARSLMSRAGVSPEHAERVLGHVIKGVEGIYDRYAYRDEKRIALEKLAALIADILAPPADKVVPIRGRP